MVFGIAFVYGSAETFSFVDIYQRSSSLIGNSVFLIGFLFILIGIGFKIAAFPYQMWAPDVYQGAPTPTTAFLAVGSKAAGIVLLIRMAYAVAPNVVHQWTIVLIFISAATILYGNLCAIAQTNLKRLFGYSSIAHAGYLLLGIAALNSSGASAVLYYLTGYLFTVIAAFTVMVVVLNQMDNENISALAGLNQRSPLLAGAMTLSVVSLAGIPPLAGFVGKFLLFKSALEEGAMQPAFYGLVGVAIVGVVISIWYYFNIIRTMFWSGEVKNSEAIEVPTSLKVVLWICILGMLYLGIFPATPLELAESAVAVLP